MKKRKIYFIGLPVTGLEISTQKLLERAGHETIRCAQYLNTYFEPLMSCDVAILCVPKYAMPRPDDVAQFAYLMGRNKATIVLQEVGSPSPTMFRFASSFCRTPEEVVKSVESIQCG